MTTDTHDTPYDTLEQARKLKDVGFGSDQAEALALGMRDAARSSRNDLATKADIAALEGVVNTQRTSLEGLVNTQRTSFEAQINTLRSDVKTEIADLRASMYRALWLQGAGIIAIIAALRLIPLD